MAGAAIDQAFLSKPTKRSGPRLDTLQVTASSEGAAIPRLYGTARIGGQIIWATNLEEIASTRKVGSKGARQTVTEYAYRANLAIGLCEGQISHIRRVWPVTSLRPAAANSSRSSPAVCQADFRRSGRTGWLPT